MKVRGTEKVWRIKTMQGGVSKTPKSAESIGQSLYYALQTNKRAGIVLIFKKPKDYRYYLRLNSVIMENKLAIDVWMIGNK